MSDPLDITDEEAEGLARLAQAQLRLALRLSERALDEADAEASCRLARASERVARGYRQSLLLKSRLKREDEAARRQATLNPLPRTPQTQARVNQRIRDVHEAVERIIEDQAETLDPEAIDDLRVYLLETLEEEGRDDGFLAEAIETQIARMCDDLGLPRPAPARPRGEPDTS